MKAPSKRMHVVRQPFKLTQKIVYMQKTHHELCVNQSLLWNRSKNDATGARIKFHLQLRKT